MQPRPVTLVLTHTRNLNRNLTRARDPASVGVKLTVRRYFGGARHEAVPTVAMMVIAILDYDYDYEYEVRCPSPLNPNRKWADGLPKLKIAQLGNRRDMS